MKNIIILLILLSSTSCLREPKNNIKPKENIENTNLEKISYSGYYENKNIGSLAIELNENNLLKFEITSRNENYPCTGSLIGYAKLTSKNTAIYTDEDCESLKFIFSKNKDIEVIENKCSAYHGMRCFFSGVYKK